MLIFAFSSKQISAVAIMTRRFNINAQYVLKK